MSNKPEGFTEIAYDKKMGELIEKRVEYSLIERDGKMFAEPVDKPRGNVGIGDGGVLFFDSWWPLEGIACCRCGVYGLIHTIHAGEYACANCGMMGHG